MLKNIDINKKKIKVILIARSKKLLNRVQQNLPYPKLSQIISKDLRSLSACNFVGKKVNDYIDDDIISSEVSKIFYDHPVPIALSAELKKKNSYKATKVIDTPLLITRDEEGVVRTFINICKHRGAPVCPEGRGEKSKFNCTYHGWMYDNKGGLINIFKSDTFGDIDTKNMINNLKDFNYGSS